MSNAINQGISYVTPFSDRVHWHVLLLDYANYMIHHFDSLGGSIPPTEDSWSVLHQLRNSQILENVIKQTSTIVGNG